MRLIQYIALGLIIIFSPSGLSQTLRGLFVNEGHIPNVTVPFEVSSSNEVHIKHIVFDRNEASCKTLLDPHSPEIFHVRCAEEGTVQMRVFFLESGVLKAIYSSNIDFQYPSGGTTVDPNPPSDPDIQAGKTYFDVWCLKCHSGASLSGRTSTQIKSALTLPVMVNEFNAQNKTFSDAEINAISSYLRSLK